MRLRTLAPPFVHEVVTRLIIGLKADNSRQDDMLLAPSLSEAEGGSLTSAFLPGIIVCSAYHEPRIRLSTEPNRLPSLRRK